MQDNAVRDVDQRNLLHLAAKIVAAYVGNNEVSMQDLPGLLETIHSSLYSLTFLETVRDRSLAQKPAIPISLSIGEDYLICLEDGKKFKSLKRHLRARYDMTPDEYREKWGLPHDYPMVAPNYSKKRSTLAKQTGLGRSDKS
jgi:predicted transcriptional regulator